LKKFKTDVVQGKPVDKILEYAERGGIELIIMASAGLSGLSKITALGSVSREVLERSKCPVMIVH
jgi:nucleotide-binding universal stress UspA family protein